MDKKYVDLFWAGGFKGKSNDVLRNLILFDSEFCIASYNNDTFGNMYQSIEHLLIKEEWPDFEVAKYTMENILRNHRKYFYITITGGILKNFATTFRATVHTKLLHILSEKKPDNVWKSELKSFTCTLRDNWYKEIREEIIDEYVGNYRNAYKALTESETEYLQRYNETFGNYSKQLKDILTSIYLNDINSFKTDDTVSKSIRKSSGLENHEKFFSIKENRIAFQCFVEIYLSENSESTEKKWYEYLDHSWNDKFPQYILSHELKQNITLILGINQEVKSRSPKVHSNFERYFRALGVVICNGNIQNIRSESVLRCLVLNRTVAMKLSLLDAAKAKEKMPDNVLIDIYAYLSYINYVTNKAEDKDILEIMDMYMNNGRFNPASIQMLNKCGEIWKQTFHSMKDFLNGRNKAVSVLNDKIGEMENALEKSAYNTLKQLVLDLDRSSFGFQLGKLYRFSKGIDAVSIDEARRIASCLLDQLNNMGIKPVAGESLEQDLLENSELFNQSIPINAHLKEGCKKLVYPGWSINGTLVALPVYKTKE